MKKYKAFIIKTASFIIAVLGLVTALWIFVIWKRANVCYNEKATTLVLGSSRIQYSFDDSIVPNSWNVGLNADNYNIMLLKLKLLHHYNPQIKNLVLLCDQDLIYHYFSGVEYKLHPYYWDFMTFDDFLFILKNDKILLYTPLQWLKILYPIKSFFGDIKFNELGIGGYTKLERNKLKEDLAREEHNANNSERRTPNINQILYLNKIIDYCNNNQIEITFINSPSYPTKNIIEGNKALKEFINTTYSNIKFIDYELINFPDSCYGDIGHLNYHGATIFSKKFAIDYNNIINE